MNLKRDNQGRFVKGTIGFWKGKKLPKHVVEGKRILMSSIVGEKHPRWNGGKSKCLDCDKLVSSYQAKRCRSCMDKINVGKNHPNWKGGYEYKLHCNRQRLAMKKGAVGSHELIEWEELKKKFGFKCLACDRQEPEITLSEDHIVPLSKGGSDNIENIQPLCRGCNSRKYNKIISYAKN